MKLDSQRLQEERNRETYFKNIFLKASDQNIVQSIVDTILERKCN